MTAEDTNKVMTTVSEAGPIREPVEYPEHDDSGFTTRHFSKAGIFSLNLLNL
jgi:hypothetical protein